MRDCRISVPGFAKSILGFAVTVFALISSVATAQAQVVVYDLTTTSVLRINLPQSQSVTVTVSDAVGELVVANPEIADAQPITDQSLYLVGKNLGRTTVSLFNADRRPVGLIEVEVGVDTDDIARSIRSVVPTSNVQVGTVNGRVRLTGEVPDAETLAQVIAVASQYGSDSIINAVAIKGGQQVNLEVRILEATRTAGKELGINWRMGPIALNPDNPNEVIGVNGGPGNTAAMTGQNVFAGDNIGVIRNGAPGSTAAGTGNTFATFITNIISGTVNLDLIINALESKGAVRTLAEPNLTTLSGQEASFLAGGEVPVRLLDADGLGTIEYKDFGVQLKFLPVVLSGDRIQIRLAPEVSELAGLTANGDPIFSTRNLDSTIELRDGQSFAVAGLLQSNNVREQDQVPWIGDIPILGTLFRSSSYQKRETELVVIVTPRLVRPSVPGQVAVSPLDSAQSSNDAEFFLLGQVEVTRELVQKFENGDGIIGPFGHIVDTE
ncbi:type II and III secretion system protein family protein [Devosia sp. XJ19-1]|uniref:Type II and III secretion system protein family protein n=1 Tax=Devosia ureilytica TaxID=2952754 RepID=A0A9Q4AP17_9HYPH|nr:type II and III secretion system protein family protein [Devosia ureilytica]MCP8883582.1 type II and III secretion system protein family protein [Devosia ureilytica]MCP8887190.1 type II and III secretion system protein family protein [Devosia ureilytica]